MARQSTRSRAATRSGTRATPRPPTRPYVHAHREGTAVWIDMFWVPEARRRQGVGRATYEAWEARLPATVTTVILFAADTGDGPSDAFWEAMGFEYVYRDDGEASLDYEDAHLMQKGVNGHRTPKPRRLD